MLNYQRGATLLEAILAAAIMGWVLSYIGTQLKIYAINQKTEETVNNILKLVLTSEDYLLTYHLKVDPLTSDGKDYVPNPSLMLTGLGFNITKNIRWLKKESCNPKGIIPDNVVKTYLPCNFNNHEMFDLIFIGFNLEYVTYSNVMYPRVIRYIKNGSIQYVSDSNKNTDNFFRVVNALSKAKKDGEFKIDENQIILSKYKKSGSSYTLEAGSNIPLTSLMGPDNLDSLSRYIKSVTSGNVYAAVDVPVISENKPKEIYLKNDGSILMEKDKALCWESRTGVKKPCLRSVSDKDNYANFLIAEGGFAFGEEKKRTSVEVSLHVFRNNEDVYIPYLKCPFGGSLVMNNKITAFSSSFSTGSEDSTNFENPSNIRSKGTKGANGKHAMMSGLSLQWTQDDVRQRWIINGSIGFDGSYAAANEGKSVLRNPKSMSFVVLQWCKEI